MDDVKRIAFVTQHYLELQGLNSVLYGAGLLFGVLAAQQAVGTSGRVDTAINASMSGMLIFVAAMMYLPASYRRTFGDAVATVQQKVMATLPTTMVLLGAMADMFGALDRQGSSPSFAAIALAAYASWVVLRNGFIRAHHLIGVAAGLAGGIVTAAVPATGVAFGPDPARAHVFLLAYALIGVGLVAGGLGDHLLLANSMSPSREAATQPPGTLAWRGLRRAWTGVCVAAAAAGALELSESQIVGSSLFFMLALLASFIVPAVVDAFHAVRDFGKRPLVVPGKGSILRVGSPEVAAAALVALGTAMHIALFAPSRPTLPALAIAMTSAALAMSSPDRRTSRIVRAVAVAVALAFFPSLSPGRALFALVGALGTAVVVEGLLEVRMPRLDAQHANTI